MNIEWRRVTWYSQIAAIVVGVGIFALGFYLGAHSGGFVFGHNILQNPLEAKKDASSVSAVFRCAKSKEVHATFSQNKVDLELSDGRSLDLPQAVSASGARYTNADESFVFWNKGNTAFITEGDATTYSDCVTF